MNMQQVRLSNTSQVLINQRGGHRQTPNGYQIGEHLTVREDVDLQVENEVVSVPMGSKAVVRENNSQQLLVDLGEGLGSFVLDITTVGKYFERVAKTESVDHGRRLRMHEDGNPTVAAPGAYVKIMTYDPNIGSNRGPKSPGQGGYATLVGQKGQLVTVFGVINGVKTYKVQLEKGGEFVFGETEFQVIHGAGTQESLEESAAVDRKPDLQALMAVGLGL